MLQRLRPRSVPGWIGWATFTLVFLSWPFLSAGSSLGFRLVDLPAMLVIASLAGAFNYALFKSMSWMRNESARQDAPRTRPNFDQELADSMARSVARAESDQQDARRIRAEPWYADAVVNLDEVASRWFVDGHGLADTVLTIPNPYFVLPLAALVKWGFATAVEVREATQWASSDTPPVRWQNPILRERLNFMGWSDTEAYARVGLLHWRTDPEIPDPAAAMIEEKFRASGQIYDVARPASLA